MNLIRARKWEGFVPENEIREYLPRDVHLHHFVRERDRNRQVLEECVVDLAVAGWLMDNPVWSRLSARMVLSMVHTPQWFEGPVCCFPGSDFHHVCFTEDHCLSAVVIALGFLGDMLTKPAIDLVLSKIEEVWKWVDFKCTERGYRFLYGKPKKFTSNVETSETGLPLPSTRTSAGRCTT